MTGIDSREVWSVTGMLPVRKFPLSALLWFIDNLEFLSPHQPPLPYDENNGPNFIDLLNHGRYKPLTH